MHGGVDDGQTLNVSITLRYSWAIAPSPYTLTPKWGGTATRPETEGATSSQEAGSEAGSGALTVDVRLELAVAVHDGQHPVEEVVGHQEHGHLGGAGADDAQAARHADPLQGGQPRRPDLVKSPCKYFINKLSIKKKNN